MKSASIRCSLNWCRIGRPIERCVSALSCYRGARLLEPHGSWLGAVNAACAQRKSSNKMIYKSNRLLPWPNKRVEKQFSLYLLIFIHKMGKNYKQIHILQFIFSLAYCTLITGIIPPCAIPCIITGIHCDSFPPSRFAANRNSIKQADSLEVQVPWALQGVEHGRFSGYCTLFGKPPHLRTTSTSNYKTSHFNCALSCNDCSAI